MLNFSIKKILSASLILAFSLSSFAVSYADESEIFVSDSSVFNLKEELQSKNATMCSLYLPSKKEIQEKYFELGLDKSATTKYSQNYSLSVPYSAGALSTETLQQSLNTVNFIRYTAGVDSVTLNDTYNNLAQHASLVNAANGYLSHSPSQPSGMSDDVYALGKKGSGSSNLGYGYSTIPDSIIRGYMEDTDTSNIDRLGHRRWIINPPMQQIGFGMVGTFTATYVFDNSFGCELADDFIAWPPENMPYELYTPSYMGYAFSVNLGYYYDEPSIEDVTVELYSKLQNKHWLLDKDNTDINSDYLNVDNLYYGMNKCIIFNVGEFANNDEVTVNINGIYKNGVHSPITYTVKFFSVYDEIKPDAPKNVVGTCNNGSVRLVWDKVDEATSYRIYRSTTAGGEKTLLKTVTSTSFTDSNVCAGATYYYYIRAFDSNSSTISNYSDAEVVSTPSTPVVPTNIKVVSGGGNATITWDAVNGATSYRVYRSTSLTGTRTLEKVRTSTYYIDTNVDTGKTYYYWLVAYNANTGFKSSYSGSSKVTITDSFAKNIEIKSVNVLSTAVTLKWDMVPGATSYRIYRRNDDNSRSLIHSQSMTEFKDTGLTKGKAYKYEIRAYSATTKALTDYSAIKQVRPMAAPTIQSGNVKGKITWDKNLVATSYRVYRADSLTGAKKLLDPTKLLTYTDTTAVKGKTYYYFVAAYDNTTGTLSAYSQPKIIKIS